MRSRFLPEAVLFLLLGFSVVSWAVIFTKRRQIRRAEVESERFIDIFWDAKNLATIQTASGGIPRTCRMRSGRSCGRRCRSRRG